MKTIVLFPGGFKPIHAGHLSLIRRYAKLNEVSKIRLLIGPKERDSIDQDISIKIAHLFLIDNKITIEASKYPSPVLTAFKEVEYATYGSYTLATSTKGSDFKRAQDFIEKHQPGQKYYNLLANNVKIVNLAIKCDPLLYENRLDGYNGPISSTILRKDIAEQNYDNFITNYPGEHPIVLQTVWNMLIYNYQNKCIPKI